MNWDTISLSITTFLKTDHPTYHCFLFTEHNGNHKSKVIDIDTANKLMWELKKKGFETKVKTDYNPFSSRIYTREIRWLHLDWNYGED